MYSEFDLIPYGINIDAQEKAGQINIGIKITSKKEKALNPKAKIKEYDIEFEARPAVDSLDAVTNAIATHAFAMTQRALGSDAYKYDYESMRSDIKKSISRMFAENLLKGDSILKRLNNNIKED